MLKFTGFDDLRNTPFFPRTPQALEAAKADLFAHFDQRLRTLTKPPQSVVEAATALCAFLKDPEREKDLDLEGLAVAALGYLFGEDDAIPDSVEFVGYTDDSIVLDAVLGAIAESPKRRAATAKVARKPAKSPKSPKKKAAPAARKKPARKPAPSASRRSAGRGRKK